MGTGVLFRATVDIVTPSIYWPGEWYWNSASSRVDGYAPTMLQAMCAALGISIAQHDGDALTGPYATARVGDYCCMGATPDGVARAALLEHHRVSGAKP